MIEVAGAPTFGSKGAGPAVAASMAAAKAESASPELDEGCRRAPDLCTEHTASERIFRIGSLGFGGFRV